MRARGQEKKMSPEGRAERTQKDKAEEEEIRDQESMGFVTFAVA